MVGPVIANFGSEEQKEKFLPATASLDIWWCQGFSEPEAGSDLASLRTKGMQVNEITSAEQKRMFDKVKPVYDKNVPTIGAEPVTVVLDALKKARGG